MIELRVANNRQTYTLFLLAIHDQSRVSIKPRSPSSGQKMGELAAVEPAETQEVAISGRRVLLLTLTLCSSLGMVASTIYVPSLPAIALALDTSVAQVQFTFVGYLLAFAVSMLVIGPLSDRCGRKQTLICGLALCAFGSIVCAVSPTVDILIAARVVQGMGACAGLVVGRAVTRDLWTRNAAAQVMAGRAVAATLMQAFAPVLGGYLQGWLGWRANFAVIVIFAMIAIALVICNVPGSRVRTSIPFPIRSMLASYRTLFGTRRFLAYAFTATGAHAGFHIFAAGAPAVLIIGFGVLPQDYGYYASLPPFGFLVGSFLSNRMTRALGVDAMIAIGGAVLIPAGFVMIALALLHFISPYAIIGPMILICCGSGLITPNAVAGSLGVNARDVGTASGLVSFIQMTGAAAATAALSLGSSGNPRVLAMVIAFAGLIAVTAFASLTQFGRLSGKADAQASV
jgi:MFS transporter, DHA1 family, multidrug resistance protein